MNRQFSKFFKRIQYIPTKITKKKEARHIEDLTKILQEAKLEECKMELLIEQYSSYILKCASAVSRRYISKSDDEWSVALSAFSQAVYDYQPERGTFFSFAELVIRRRLADYFKSQERYRAEILASPEIFSSGSLEGSPQPALQVAVSSKLAVSEPEDLRLEIEAAGQTFSRYGFSFFDLSDCSPKSQKTKDSCAKAVAFLIKHPLLLSELRTSRQLPMKAIEKNAKVPRKILDRHRKYIIAAVEILSGEYPGLAEYMRFIRKEIER
jgi:RNA polymerase sigma factor